MAEFQEVMRQFGRMCAEAGCSSCPLYDRDGTTDGCSMAKFINKPKIIEDEVMEWVAVHPEPVYPTWMEWLTDVLAIPKAAIWDESLVYDALQEHITADIAEKLGIEPKEG